MAEEFAERMLRTMNEASLALMVSVGHRTGLFDVMAGMPAATSAEIAAAGGAGRTVRPGMAGGDDQPAGSSSTTARPADLCAAGRARRLAHPVRRHAEPGHRDAVHRADGSGGRPDRGAASGTAAGSRTRRSPRFQAVMAEDSGAVHDATLIDVMLPLVPGLVDRLKDGIDVADVGCGSGHAVNLMAAAFPRSRFTGFDFSDDRDRRGPRRRPSSRAWRTRASSSVTPPGWARPRGSTSSPPSTRCTTRPGPTWCSPGSPRPCGPAGIYLCVDTSASSQLAENLAPSARAVPVHRLVPALHDRVPGRRRDGPGHHVGRADGPADARRGGLHLGRGQAPSTATS